MLVRNEITGRERMTESSGLFLKREVLKKKAEVFSFLSWFQMTLLSIFSFFICLLDVCTCSLVSIVVYEIFVWGSPLLLVHLQGKYKSQVNHRIKQKGKKQRRRPPETFHCSHAWVKRVLEHFFQMCVPRPLIVSVVSSLGHFFVFQCPFSWFHCGSAICLFVMP